MPVEASHSPKMIGPPPIQHFRGSADNRHAVLAGSSAIRAFAGASVLAKPTHRRPQPRSSVPLPIEFGFRVRRQPGRECRGTIPQRFAAVASQGNDGVSQILIGVQSRYYVGFLGEGHGAALRFNRIDHNFPLVCVRDREGAWCVHPPTIAR
jgi:hypothetical protein